MARPPEPKNEKIVTTPADRWAYSFAGSKVPPTSGFATRTAVGVACASGSAAAGGSTTVLVASCPTQPAAFPTASAVTAPKPAHRSEIRASEAGRIAGREL